jgi:DNA-binding transcriptional regulator YdaS (Cro superfamily)
MVMTTIDLHAETRRARTLRQKLELDQMDYRREIARLSALGTQRELAQLLRISQPSLSGALKKAETVPPARPGFSGATPYEVCQRYAVGEITREQLVDELTRWEYVIPPKVEYDYFDDLREEPPGSFNDVLLARNAGLIDDDIYGRLLDVLAEDPE